MLLLASVPLLPLPPLPLAQLIVVGIYALVMLSICVFRIMLALHFSIQFELFRYKYSNNWNKNKISAAKHQPISNKRSHLQYERASKSMSYKSVVCAFASLGTHYIQMCKMYKCIHTIVVIFYDHWWYRRKVSARSISIFISYNTHANTDSPYRTDT